MSQNMYGVWTMEYGKKFEEIQMDLQIIKTLPDSTRASCPLLFFEFVSEIW